MVGGGGGGMNDKDPPWLAEAGIYVDKTGKPYCRECIRIRSRRAYWRKRNAIDEATAA